jgi:3-oxoacyl-[acyl-carrier-protein] synthase-3
MPDISLAGTAIKGIACAVPLNRRTLEEVTQLAGAEETAKILQNSGVRSRRVARPGVCASDLSFAAAQALLGNLGWDPATIEALVLVSQSFDYPAPATSCILQARLGLPKSCAAFDVASGCSGYVYGLWIATGLIAGGCRRVLLLAGDLSSRFASPFDRATMPLFGDAGSATALERDSSGLMHFTLGTDGTGHQHLIMRSGGAWSRLPRSAKTMIRTKQPDGVVRSDEDLYMNGKESFAFTLREVPPMIASVLKRSQWDKNQVDAYYFHQVNRFILDYLAKRMGLPLDKVPIVLEHFGNTSSASIPLAMTHWGRERLTARKQRVVLAGFGVGYSWAATALELGPIVMPPLEEVP